MTPPPLTPSFCSNLSPIPTSLFPCKSLLLHVSYFHLPTIHHSHIPAHIRTSRQNMSSQASQNPSSLKGRYGRSYSMSRSSSHTHTQRRRVKSKSSKHPLPSLSLSPTLALLGTPAVISVFLTDYPSRSSYRSPALPQPANKSTPDKTLADPGHCGQRCEMTLMFPDHTELNTAGRSNCRAGSSIYSNHRQQKRLQTVAAEYI